MLGRQLGVELELREETGGGVEVSHKQLQQDKPEQV
jgi:hypothetical protein